MRKKINKFDSLAYAISVLGQPHKTGEDRYIEASHGVVAVVHTWFLPCGRFLEVEEWSDGVQSTAGEAGPVIWNDTVGVRGNDDGSEYEEQARALIDSYAEAVK